MYLLKASSSPNEQIRNAISEKKNGNRPLIFLEKVWHLLKLNEKRKEKPKLKL